MQDPVALSSRGPPLVGVEDGNSIANEGKRQSNARRKVKRFGWWLWHPTKSREASACNGSRVEGRKARKDLVE